jgi:hypothetical protein
LEELHNSKGLWIESMKKLTPEYELECQIRMAAAIAAGSAWASSDVHTVRDSDVRNDQIICTAEKLETYIKEGRNA